MIISEFQRVRKGETGDLAVFAPETNTNLPRASQKPPYGDEYDQDTLRNEIAELEAARESAFSHEKPKIEAQIKEYREGFNSIASAELAARMPHQDMPTMASRQKPKRLGWGA